MDRSSVVKYVVDMTEVSAAGVRNIVTMAWNSKNFGNPTVESIETFMVYYIKSLQEGGVNSHIFNGSTIPNYPKAVVRDQFTGEKVVWVAPMFWVV